MKAKEKIRAEIARLQNVTMDKFGNFNSAYSQGEYDALCALEHFIDSMPEETVSEDLEAAQQYAKYTAAPPSDIAYHFIAGTNWQRRNLWKEAQGNYLPEIDREVIAFQGRKIVFAHRPNPNGWDGKSLSTGEIEHYTPQTYDKGGWNIPDVKFWLDAPLPEGIEQY